MSLHSRNIGNNLVFYQGHQKRIIDAFGPDVVKWESDYVNGQLSAANAPLGWTITLVGLSTLTKADSTGGALLLTTAGAENDGVSMQLAGEAYKIPATGTNPLLYFGCRLESNDVVQSDLLIGMCITDTTLLGGMSDGMYFRKVDESAVVEAVTEKNTTETATAAVKTLVVNVRTTFEIVYEYAMLVPRVYFFVDGALVATHTTNLPDDEELTPSVEYLTGEANATILTLDWLRAIQIGRNAA